METFEGTKVLYLRTKYLFFGRRGGARRGEWRNFIAPLRKGENKKNG